MIIGLGLDLCPISRMQQAMTRSGERFTARVFTPGERLYCQSRGLSAQHFAARFAAKEALLKALGVPAGLSWHEIEVRSQDGGAPSLHLSGAAAAAAAALGVTRLHLSLTHAGDSAAAVVIAEHQ